MDPEKDATPRGKLLRAFAALAEPFYAAAVSLRNFAFDRGVLKVHRAHVPVISVGNLTTGGTGKTPMVARVVDLLQKRGRRPAVILRGYKSTAADGSDEQKLLADMLPGVPVIANPDRVAAALHLQRDHPEVDVIVLDDGFQHRRIARDFDLLLIDATNPFGHGLLLPRGLLREPREPALRRASAIVLTHVDRIEPLTLAQLTEELEHASGKTVDWFDHVWGRVVDEKNQPVRLLDESGKRLWPADRPRLLAFCGIGNPAPFFDTAAAHMTVADRRAFDDHHAYTAAELETLRRRAVELGADALLTTEKDWVKLRSLVESTPPGLPIWRPELRVEWTGGRSSERALDNAILQAIHKVPQ